MNEGLCSGCAHRREVVSAKGSRFLLCTHPLLAKYPPLPVLACRGYRPKPPTD